ncbi:uncharacterized protein [Osmerus mordax]|uniref:uncharacterized protein n=1 Tax=Osmerus mordax TaxID=8014 RepID=UPI00350FE1DE
MSLEYTIDIQLTELGFPDIFEAEETPVKETHDATSSINASTSPEPPVENLPTPSPSPPRTPEASQTISEEESEKDDGGEGDDGQGIVRGVQHIETGTCNAVNGQEEESGLETEDTDDSGVSEREQEDEDDDDEEDDGLPSVTESGGSSEHRCGVCDQVLSSEFQLREHMNLHTGERPYCCAECGKRFCQLVNYRSHLRTHAQPKPLAADCCRICRKTFESVKALKQHLSTSHFEPEFYECDVCKRIFTNRSGCEDHIKWHKAVMGSHVCPTCGRHFHLGRSLKRHMQRKCRKWSYVCCDCPLVFKSKNALLKHSFTHLGLLPYTCVQCRRHFRLARHYNQHKCEPDRIQCVACLGVFTSQDDFQRHKKDTGCWGHQGSKGSEIRCMECGEGFASMEELKNHAGAHQRVLTCFVCGKGFRSSLLLMSHMGGHASQRPYLCQKCGVGFPHQQDYDCHLKNCGSIVLPTMAPKKPQTTTQAAATVSPPQHALKIAIPVHKPGPQVPIPVYKRAPTAVHKPVQNVPVPSASASMIPMPVYKPASPAPVHVYKPIKAMPTVVGTPITLPAGVLNSVPAPGQEGDGLWKLSLDKNPPPGVKLVVFVPTNSRLASGLSGSSTGPETPASSGGLPKPPVMVLPPAPRTGLGVEHTFNPVLSPSPGVYQHPDVPLDLVKKPGGNKQEPSDILPLDLSMSSSPKATLPGPPPFTFLPSIKSESRDLGSSVEPTGSALDLVLVKKEPQCPRPSGGEQNPDTRASNEGTEELLQKGTCDTEARNGRSPVCPLAAVKTVDPKFEKDGHPTGEEGGAGRAMGQTGDSSPCKGELRPFERAVQSNLQRVGGSSPATQPTVSPSPSPPLSLGRTGQHVPFTSRSTLSPPTKRIKLEESPEQSS